MNDDSTIASGALLNGPFDGSSLQRLAELASYRTLIYFATFLSGAVSLTFQVVWQRYLSFLVGSEARSISLVVAVFLLGLAAGYRFWGNMTARGWDRSKLLKATGYIELAIAAYAIVFPVTFGVIRDVAYAAPASLIVDFIATSILLLLPTFLMGASIPLLTAAVPETMDEVNYCHSRIYGINTLGAFLGAFVAGFFLVPALGLVSSLHIGAVVNILVGVIFIFNTVQGDVRKGGDIPSIPNQFGASGIYLFVFITGAVTIAFEVIFMRLFALSIGSGHYIFPIVVGIVILGLAVGSLSIRRGSVTANRVIYELVKLGVLLTVVYVTVPWWGYWLSHVRVSLTSIPSNYGVYLAIVVLFAAVFLLPVVIPMGRLLPMGYSLIDKQRSDYGKQCGRVYFSNTIGTVLGAVGLGYVLLMFLDIDSIFRINIALILLLAAYLVYRQRVPSAALACITLAAVALALPLIPGGKWDRQLHVQGLFRSAAPEPFHFSGWFGMPDIVTEKDVLFLTDDPTSTVAATRVARPNSLTPSSATIYVNGKSDGNTRADYSNMSLTAALPYLYARAERDLEAAVIGLGMGITSGSFAAFDDVKEVTTLEISRGVREAVEERGIFDEWNMQLSKNPKSRVVQTDAFRYFTRADRKFDIIASEPSNPWVVGVDNLYTPEFYTMVRDSLTEGGIFFQWLQIYEINETVLSAIVRNVALHFDYVNLYILGQYDVGIIASNKPLDGPHVGRRMSQESTRRVLEPMALHDEDLLVALRMMNTQQVRAIGLGNIRPLHSMERPWLGHEAGRARFLGTPVRVNSTLLGGVGRHLIDDEQRRKDFARLADEYSDQLELWCEPDLTRHSADFVCAVLDTLFTHYQGLRRPLTPHQIPSVLSAYNELREFGYINPDIALLERIRGMVLDTSTPLRPDELINALSHLAEQYALERMWDRAHALVSDAYDQGILTEPQRNLFESDLARTQSIFERRIKGLVQIWGEHDAVHIAEPDAQ